ncbi:MAG: hypothetical protein OEW98_00070 [Betaproteobacteria bacterium]|nr:hypothetical protein [Betaproteobacteria bacterium]
MLTIVTFKWQPPPGYRSAFRPEAVIALRDMVARHYPAPHRFVCITDDAKGLKDVETLPLWSDHATVPSPHGRGNPSCYRRLKLFDPAIASLLGPRFLSLDLDTVIVGDVRPIFDRPEDFVIWGETNPNSFYNGSMFLLTAGARAKVWTEFNPKTSPMLAKRAGRFGSDQGWISYCLGPGEARWGRDDGVYSFRVHLEPQGTDTLPANCRIVMFHGKVDPWDWRAQRLAWVREHWGVAA